MQTGREIYFSLCGALSDDPFTLPLSKHVAGWASWYAPEGWSLGNSWRINGDCNQWPSVVAAILYVCKYIHFAMPSQKSTSHSVNQGLSQYARPGGWNDPDMLVGSSPLAAVYNTPDQSRTQFSLWAIMAAPLLIGSNMLNMSVRAGFETNIHLIEQSRLSCLCFSCHHLVATQAFDLETYTNSEVVAIDQDTLGVQGQVIWENCQTLSGVPPCQQVRTVSVNA